MVQRINHLRECKWQPPCTGDREFKHSFSLNRLLSCIPQSNLESRYICGYGLAFVEDMNIRTLVTSNDQCSNGIYVQRKLRLRATLYPEIDCGRK